MTKNGAGRTFWRLFLQPVIENRGGDGFLGAGLAKNKFCTDMLGLLSPKTTLNIFQGLMNVSGSHRCFSSLFSTNAALYSKNDLVSSQNALSTEDLIFIWFLANDATKFHIAVIQWERKLYIAQKRYIMALFLKILITYNCHNNLIFYMLKFWY